MSESLSKHYPKEDGTRLEEPSREDLELLACIVGWEAIHFLQSKSTLHKEVNPTPNYYRKATFITTVEGRVLEFGVGNEAVEIHFAFEDAYINQAKDMFEQIATPQNFGSSLKFLRFLNDLLATFNKDARIIVFGSNGKRGELFSKMVKRHGLKNAVLMNFVD